MLDSLLHPAIMAAFLIGLAAATTDLRTRRVPNALTFSGAVIGVVLHTALTGSDGLIRAVIGAATGVAIFLPFFVLGGMGGGDVKLMGALGACLGAAGVVRVGLLASLLGGAIALAAAVAGGRLFVTLRNVGRLLFSWLRHGPRPSKEFSLENPGALKIPYAVPIACSVFLVTLLG